MSHTLHQQLHAAAPHQQLLARFHSALSHIHGWRVVLSITSSSNNNNTSSSPPANPADGDDAASPLAAAAAAVAPGPGSEAASSSSAAAAGMLNTQPSSQPTTAGSGGSSASARQDAGTSSSSSSKHKQPTVGHPLPLTLRALQSGGWACGCLMTQQQEQSCWVRFKLPSELVTDQLVLVPLSDKRLVSDVCVCMCVERRGVEGRQAVFACAWAYHAVGLSP